MRSNKEFLEEIYSRGERYKEGKRRQRRAIMLSAIPIAISVAIVASIAASPLKMGVKKSEGYDTLADKAPTANQTNDIAQGEDAAEDVVNDVAEEDYGYAMDGDYEVIETQSQIHLPNQEVDGDLLSQQDAAEDNAATSTAPITQDSLAAATQQSQSVSSKTSQMDSAKTESEATNNGQLEAPQWHKELLKKWKQVIDAESFTLTYGTHVSLVNDEKAVDKMELFITEAGNNIVDYSNKSVELITIEMGGMKFKLRSGLLCNETLEENYKLNPMLISVLRNILAESDLLTDDLSRGLNVISKSLEPDEAASSADVTNGAASASAYKE